MKGLCNPLIKTKYGGSQPLWSHQQDEGQSRNLKFKPNTGRTGMHKKSCIDYPSGDLKLTF